MIVKNINSVIYDTIKEEILYMDLLPGELVSEIETAKRFSVSRTPVREAFKKLEYEGLVEIVSHSGTYVTLINLEEIGEIRFMREQIELRVFKLLIDNFDETIDKKLKTILDKQGQLFKDNLEPKVLAKKFIKSDNEFHEEMFKSVGKLGVWKQLQSMEHHYERLRMFLNVYDLEHLYSLYKDHLYFYENIVNKDYAKIIDRYISHLHKGLVRGSDLIASNPQYFINVEK